MAGSLGQLDVVTQNAQSLGTLNFQKGFEIAKETERVARKGELAMTEPKVQNLISYLKQTLDDIDS